MKKQLRITNYELRSSSLVCKSGGYPVIGNCMQFRGLIRARMKNRDKGYEQLRITNYELRNGFVSAIRTFSPLRSSSLSLRSRTCMKVWDKGNEKLISHIPFPLIPYPWITDICRERKAIFGGVLSWI